MTYEMKCNCGETVSVKAANRSEAIRKVKELMTKDAIKEHMESEHPGQPVPTPEEAHARIEQNLIEVA